MNDDAFNMSMRKFLKRVGVTSQQEIEKAVRAAEAAGTLGAGPLQAKVVLTVAGASPRPARAVLPSPRAPYRPRWRHRSHSLP
ncbi:MAG: DUF6494 family protein [Pseudomonadota bacterium]